MYCVKLHKSTNLKMCLRLTEMYSKVFHPQRIQYHTVRIQRHHHHKEHSEVKKQSILRYLLGGGGLMGHKYQFFLSNYIVFFSKEDSCYHDIGSGITLICAIKFTTSSKPCILSDLCICINASIRCFLQDTGITI